jgi:hypothetical protein
MSMRHADEGETDGDMRHTELPVLGGEEVFEIAPGHILIEDEEGLAVGVGRQDRPEKHDQARMSEVGEETDFVDEVITRNLPVDVAVALALGAQHFGYDVQPSPLSMVDDPTSTLAHALTNRHLLGLQQPLLSLCAQRDCLQVPLSVRYPGVGRLGAQLLLAVPVAPLHHFGLFPSGLAPDLQRPFIALR